MKNEKTLKAAVRQTVANGAPTMQKYLDNWEENAVRLYQREYVYSMILTIEFATYFFGENWQQELQIMIILPDPDKIKFIERFL